MNLTQKQINKLIKKAPKLMKRTLAENVYDVDVREVPHDVIGMQQRVKTYREEIIPQPVGKQIVITFQTSGLAITVIKVEENLYYIIGNWDLSRPLAANEEKLTKTLQKFVELHGVYKKLARV